MAAVSSWESYMVRRVYHPGEYVFQEGDPGDAFYVIVSGRVAIVKGGSQAAPLVLGYRGPGDMLGEISLIQEVPRTASVMAIERSTLLALARDRFWDLIDGEPDFRHMVLSTLIGSLLAADQSRVTAATQERDLFDRLSSLSSEHERLAELMQLRHETMQFIVHDLRNPLNTIMMTLNFLEPELEANVKLAPFLQASRGALDRVLALIESLLDLDRLDEGENTLNYEPVDAAALLHHLVYHATAATRAAGIALELNLPDTPLPTLHADPARVERVLTNLLDNAFKYTPPGGRVAISAWADAGDLVVAVDDQGPGVAPEQRERLFARFAQAEHDVQARRGFGLGLAYCRSAVAAHGGRIWIEDAPGGQGARFIFTLPLPGDAGPRT